MAVTDDDITAFLAGVPAAEGVPPLLARPNAGNVPDYTADPPVPDEVKPHQAQAVRAEIQKVMDSPGFHELPPDQQRSSIIDAVHAVTRAAGAAVPLGHVTGAALESAPFIGNGRSFRENLDALDQGAADARAAHPVASFLGTTAGLGATVAASGGFGSLGLAPGATAPAASPALARLVGRGAAEGAAVGGVQGGAETAARGGDVSDVLREAGNGAAMGGVAGAAIPLAGAAIAKGMTGAINRSDARLLKEIGDGAPKVKRFKLNDRGDDVVDLVRRTPALEKAHGKPSEFAAAAGTELGKNGRELDSIYEAADKGGKIDPATAQKAVAAIQQHIGSSLAGEEVATALQPTIDKLARRADKAQPIGSRELRAEVTRLQDIAFKKGPGADTTAVQDAAKAAAGALKDVLEQHVETNLPGQVDRVRQLNNDQTLLSRIKGAADYKATNLPNENTSRLAKIGHKLADSGALAAGAGTAALLNGGVAHIPTASTVATGLAVAAAPKVLTAGVRAANEAIASAGRTLGLQRTERVGPLAQRLMQAKSPSHVNTELIAHIFGDKPADQGAADADLNAAASKMFGGDE